VSGESPSRDEFVVASPLHSLDTMDITPMILDASIASVASIAFSPFAQMRRLREIDTHSAAQDTTPD
jgi:hypothetical protein